METQNSDLNSLFNPRSIAIIGASSNPGSISGQFLRYLTRYEYKGSIYPVNPRHKEVSGLACYGSVSDIPAQVDLAICVVPNQAVIAAVKECAAKGVGYLMIPSTGFAEAGPEGERLQKRLVEIARGRTRLLGPNCMGFINFKGGVVASFGAFLENPKDMKVGKIGFVSQSGLLGARVVRRCLSRGLGLTYEVSTGNEADIESLEFIEYLINDPETRVIGALIESVKDGRRLISLGWRARELGKPIVVLKAGKSGRGIEAVSSHTGRLSSAAQIYRGVFRQGGIVEVGTFNELCLALEAFSILEKFPEEVRFAVVVGSGGNGVLIADQAEELGVPLSELPAETQAAIGALIPEAGSCRNPIDVTAQVTHNQPEKLRQVVELLAQEQSVTSMIVGVNHRCLARCWTDLLDTAEKSGKLMGITMSADVSTEVREGLKQSGRVLLAEDAEELLSMFKLVSDAAKLMKFQAERPVESSELTRYGLPPLPDSDLTEERIKKLVSPYISVPRGELARSRDEAVAIAARVGYPVAMKLVAPGLRHKTESGAVKLNVRDAGEVAEVFDELMAKPFLPKGAAGVLLEEMVSDGLEVIFGFLRSRELGPVVMFGSGGILVELVRDTTYRSLPLGRNEIARMIEECLCQKLMKGYRNQPDKDLDALVDGIAQCSKFFLANPWIREMEFNPVAVLSRGNGVKALDALIVSGSNAAG
ncbi:MAG: acetate--CoA ligase family protein [Deltaproteobacteria bacterium]|nr:acetate--CoA ligase family protein [Deltaproteobacteria bacterium]